MAKGKRHRFQSPPPEDPISAVRDSSLAFRLNFGFFFRQLGVFLLLDLLIFLLAMGGMFLYAENRCAQVAGLVEERGVPSADALAWMEASDYTIAPLDPDAWSGREGGALLSLPFLPRYPVLEEGVRTWDISSYYQVELPNGGEPYAITVDMTGIARTLGWAARVLLICEGLSLVIGLFGTHRSVRRVLRPIQELTTTAARLNATTHMSRRELESLAGELNKIDAGHLDSRIHLPAAQKELRSLAQAINGMMDRVNQAYSAQMRFVSDASHELRTPIAVIQGYAALLDRWGKSDPEALQESIDAIRVEAASMERLVEQLLFLARGGQRLPAGAAGAGGPHRPGGGGAAGGGDDPPGAGLPAPVGGGAGGGVGRPGADEAGAAHPHGQRPEVLPPGGPALSAGHRQPGPRPPHRPGRGYGHPPGEHPPRL